MRSTLLAAMAATALFAIGAAPASADGLDGFSLGPFAQYAKATYEDTGANTGLSHIGMNGVEWGLTVNYEKQVWGPIALSGAIDAYAGAPNGSRTSEVCTPALCGTAFFQRNAPSTQFGGAARLALGWHVDTDFGTFEPYFGGGLAFSRIHQTLKQTPGAEVDIDDENGVGPMGRLGVKWAFTSRLALDLHADISGENLSSFNEGWGSNKRAVHERDVGIALLWKI